MSNRGLAWGVCLCVFAAVGCTSSGKDDAAVGGGGSGGRAGATAGAGGNAGHAAGSGGAPAEPHDAGMPHDDDADVEGDAGDIKHAYDGQYNCSGATNNGDSCSSPLVDGELIPSWTLILDAAHLTFMSAGYDKPAYSCDGSWMGHVFRCPITWSRSGRVCSFTLRVSADDADHARLWPYDNIEAEYATCQRQR